MKKSKGKEKKASVQQQGVNSTTAPANPTSTGTSIQEGKEDKRKPKPHLAMARKEPEKRGEGRGSVFRYVQIAMQFLRESRMELKKVKWPNRKELLASTAVVIVLVLIVSFFLGLIDFGLIKIIRNIVG
jgi:preprotein translocase subunit SecE